MAIGFFRRALVKAGYTPEEAAQMVKGRGGSKLGNLYRDVTRGAKGVYEDITGRTASDAALEAAEIQAGAGERAQSQLFDVYQQNRSDMLPWMQTGQNALGALQALMSSGYFTPQTFTAPQATPVPGIPGATPVRDIGQAGPVSGIPGMGQIRDVPGEVGPIRDIAGMTPMGNLMDDPGYQFRMDQGLKAVRRHAAGMGGLKSGATDRELMEYAQGLASQEYQNMFSRNLAQNQQALAQSAAGVQRDLGAEQAGLARSTAGAQRDLSTDQQALARSLATSNLGLSLNEQALARDLAGVQRDLSLDQQNLARGTAASNLAMAQNQQGFKQAYNTANLNRAGTQQFYNQLANIAGLGQAQSTNLGVLGSQYGSDIGNLMTGIANAQASGLIGGANARMMGTKNLFNLLLDGLGLFT